MILHDKDPFESGEERPLFVSGCEGITLTRHTLRVVFQCIRYVPFNVTL